MMSLMSKPVRAIHGGSPPDSLLRSTSMIEGLSKTARLGNMWPVMNGLWGSLEEDEDAMTHCCLPAGCPRYYDDPISLNDPADCVRVVCTNERCREGQWMHADCFQDWEDYILNFLRSCGRARSWSEKQRHQNLWTKKVSLYRWCELLHLVNGKQYVHNASEKVFQAASRAYYKATKSLHQAAALKLVCSFVHLYAACTCTVYAHLSLLISCGLDFSFCCATRVQLKLCIAPYVSFYQIIQQKL
jgi:hypothetical protein